MCFGLFENYSATVDPSSKRKRRLSCIVVKKTTNQVFDIAKKFLEDNGFYEINANKEYNDIYGMNRGFEVSIQISPSALESLVSVSVYGERKRGRTRRFLKKFYFQLEKVLKE